MNSLFAYGTLMFPEIARRVARIHEIPIDGVLPDFARYTIEDRPIAKVPAIMKELGSKVEGKLYREISDESLKLLDEFECIDEGDYRRIETAVRTAEGILPCYTYILEGHRTLGGAWEPETFEINDLQYYLRNVVPKFEVN